MITKRLGEVLVERGNVLEEDVTKALAYQRAFGGRIGAALVRIGALSEDDLLRALSEQLDVAIVERELALSVDPEAMRDIAIRADMGINWFAANRVFFVRRPDGNLLCVAADIVDPAIRETVARIAGKSVEFGLARQTDIEAALDKILVSNASLQGDSTVEPDSVDALKELAEQAPVIDFLNRVFAQAIESRASDIHVEPAQDHFDVRMRIDGVLSAHQTVSRRLFDAVATRIKLLSGMDIAERRLPQVGRQSVRLSGEEVDLRVSTLPALHGESIVMRLLRKRTEAPTLQALGMSRQTLVDFEKLLKVPNGVILVSGPTGSGKSTTLYRALGLVRDGTRKIVTIEDPVEYEMTGVTQVQVKPEIGLSFALGLRSTLRQDPNVILVGEIRDGETAEICAQSSLTGHIVLSTIHTNSAAEAVSRLADLGVEQFLIAATVRGVLAQRLVRKLCSHCSRPASAEQVRSCEGHILTLLARRPAERENWREPRGCSTCHSTGFKGRIGLFELIVVNEAIRAAILERRTGYEIEALARDAGYSSMLLDGLSKARAGLTTYDEVLRVSGSTSETPSEVVGGAS